MKDRVLAELEIRGFAVFPVDKDTLRWAEAARHRAEVALQDPAQDHQWQCERTWFVGVDGLANDARGAIDGVPLAGPGIDVANEMFGTLPLHRAQLSGVMPGYPKPRDGESSAAFRYRLKRDGAHLDGLLPVGPVRNRFLKEPHAWILGIPLTSGTDLTSPLVVWEGSHRMMARAMADALMPHPAETWGDVDVTEPYQEARRDVFKSCARKVLVTQPGEALLLHRHILHGIAPWADPTRTSPRIVAYFRPQLSHDPKLWLSSIA